jgi:hypothetical protein
MTASRSQGEIGIEHMCQFAGSADPGITGIGSNRRRQEESGMRDAIQRLALATMATDGSALLLRREGWQANHKRVLRRLSGSSADSAPVSVLAFGLLRRLFVGPPSGEIHCRTHNFSGICRSAHRSATKRVHQRYSGRGWVDSHPTAGFRSSKQSQ